MKCSSALWLTVALLSGVPAAAAAQNPVHWSIALAPGAAPGPGKSFGLVVTASIDTGWHVYAVSQPPGGPVPLAITVLEDGPFMMTGGVVSPEPDRAFDTNFNLETLFHETRAAFKLTVSEAAGTTGSHPLHVLVSYQTCNDRLCLPPRDETLTLDIRGSGGSASSVGSATAPSVAGTPGRSEGPEGPEAPKGPEGPVPDMASSTASTFGAYVALAAVMGALSLLTPCVFPMVPITVSYFTNRSGDGRGGALRRALVYGAGIILTFTAVGFTIAVAFGASGLNRFAADPWLNLGVTALFVLFALSLFGVYELALPSRFVTAVTKAEAGRGRYAGTLLMGLAFTLTSFTCTAPFLGTLLVVAAQGNWQWPLAGMLAFSTVFALPFVVLALAPQWLAALPRSGSWLLAVKAAMGLLELAAAMKFLSNVDLVWGWGIFTRDVVLVVWILVAGVLVLYLAGAIRLGYAPRLRRPGLARLLAVAGGIVLGVWLASGLAGSRLGELEAFLPPDDLAGAHDGSNLPWIVNDYDAALARARAERRPILIDFTGYTCTNCRWMEANMFPRPEVARELSRYVRVRLFTDGRGELYQRFQDMEQRLFGTVALPYYAALTAEGRPVVAFGGLTRSSDEFIAFLRRGQG